MRRIAVSAALSAMLSLLAASPALAGTTTRKIHLAAASMSLTSFTCLNDSCSLGEATFVANAQSNLGGQGSFSATLILDFLGQSAPGGNCNIVDENDVFTIANGTIRIHSHHNDCAANGHRIDTTFDVTGGTGDFQGATGGGREFSAVNHSPVSPIIFNGTITF